MSIVYRFLERGPAAPDNGYVPDDFLKAMHSPHTAVKLFYIDGFKTIPESTVYNSIEVFETLG